VADVGRGVVNRLQSPIVFRSRNLPFSIIAGFCLCRRNADLDAVLERRAARSMILYPYRAIRTLVSNPHGHERQRSQACRTATIRLPTAFLHFRFAPLQERVDPDGVPPGYIIISALQFARPLLRVDLSQLDPFKRRQSSSSPPPSASSNASNGWDGAASRIVNRHSQRTKSQFEHTLAPRVCDPQSHDPPLQNQGAVPPLSPLFIDPPLVPFSHLFRWLMQMVFALLEPRAWRTIEAYLYLLPRT